MSQYFVKSTTPDYALAIAYGDADAANYSRFAAVIASAPVATDHMDDIKVWVFGEGGTAVVGTVLLQQAPGVSGPWYTVATITNPVSETNGGSGWSLPRAPFTRMNVSAYTSGTARGLIAGYLEAKTLK